MRARLTARLLSARDRGCASEYLSRTPLHNLHLLDLAAGLGAPPRSGEITPQLVGAWRGRELAGVASLRPGIMLDAGMSQGALDALMPFLGALEGGLIKSERGVASALWERLSSRGRLVVLDRAEVGYRVKPGEAVRALPPRGARLRGATGSDLEGLVAAARASLREEDRPDPFEGDPVGFRRWVRGRLPRARVVECDGEIAFVGYADVRRIEGWLIQGVYTWPNARRRGLAAAGVYELVREALEAGADHVQLAVVRDNAAGVGLYRKLGFEPFTELRTILFA